MARRLNLMITKKENLPKKRGTGSLKRRKQLKLEFKRHSEKVIKRDTCLFLEMKRANIPSKRRKDLVLPL